MNSQSAAVIIGQIGAPYGVKGWVHVRSFTAPQNNLQNFSSWNLYAHEKAAAKVVELEQFKAHNNNFVAKFANIADRDEAAKFTNCKIVISREDLPELAADEYYLADLIGLTAYNKDGSKIGEVTDFLETGANDVLIITTDNAVEHLIPYVLGEFILAVNLEKKELQVAWDLEL